MVAAPQDYAFLGHPLTTSPQSAVAILGAVVSITQAPSNLAGGVISDRVGKRAILVCVAIVQLWCPVVQAYTTSFSVAILVACYTGLIGGMFGGPVNALQAEVLPADENGARTHSTVFVLPVQTQAYDHPVSLAGVPLAASRDVNLIGLAWVLPGLLLPLVLAKVFAMFSDPYKVFFLSSAVMMALQSPILLCVRPSRAGTASSGAAGDGEGSPARKPSSLPDWPEQESPGADARVPLLAGSE